MKTVTIALGATLLATGTAAAAQSATDARCIILSNVFAQQAKDDNAKKTAEASMYFYLGRLGSSASAAQLKALFEAQGKTITQANAGTLMNECAKGVQTELDLLDSLAPKQQQPAQQPPKK
jgi:hypothetical protein